MVKPVHPAAVHFPIAFLFLAYGLDIAHSLRSILPASITSQLPVANDLTRGSYYLLSLGLLTALPAIITGGVEAMKMIQKQGMYEADNSTIKPKVKATIAHAVFNDIVIAVGAFIWYQRREAAKSSWAGKVPGTAAAAYAPETWMVFGEGITLVIMLMAANIGGTLTYNYGMGFSAMNNSAAAGLAKKGK